MLQWIHAHKKAVVKIAVLPAMLLTAVFFIFALLSPVNSSAQTIVTSTDSLGQGVEIIKEPLGLPSTDIRIIVANIIKAALGLLGIILVVLIIYGGYLWMTAGGNDEQIGRAKSILKNAVVGLVIVLSAYSIALFVFKLLGYEPAGTEPGAAVLNTENFQGSGALGRIIRDHYPARDQRDVPRNTKISVTFRKPLKTDSFIEDTTRDGIFGNCFAVVNSWAVDCDQIKKIGGALSDNIIAIKRADNKQMIAGGAILTSYSTENGVRGVYTIVIRPVTDPADVSTGGGYLGSPIEDTGYAVRLGPDILLDELDRNGDPVRAFNPRSIGNNYYEWQFTVNTELDTIPPEVENVFPGRDGREAKNSVIQINFSEAVDPIGIQGEFQTSAEDGGYYYIEGESIFLKTRDSTRPQGNFSLLNRYQTLEFTPSVVCDVNPCGDPIYCLPVCDKPGAACAVPKTESYDMILKAARPRATSTFEALPLSGIMDMAGNALDGDKDGIPDFARTTTPIFNNWKSPDNDYWRFTLTDEIDKSAPHIIRITPGLDAENVLPDKKLGMVFGKRMRVGPLYDIDIDEKPTHEVPIWKLPTASFSTAGIATTSVELSHGPFLDGRRQYYYPVVPSSVTDVHFNCFFPGKGPGIAGALMDFRPDTYECNGTANCCPVTTAPGRAVCCGGIVNERNASTTESCKIYIKSMSP